MNRSSMAGALLADPMTTAQTLAELAVAHPELRPQIAAHPNAYPGLIEWMRAQDPALTQSAPAAQAFPATQVMQAGQPAFAVPRKSTEPGPRKRKVGLIVGISAALLVVVGVVAFAVPLMLGSKDATAAGGGMTCGEYVEMSLEPGRQEAVALDYLIAQGGESPSDTEVAMATAKFSDYCAFRGGENDPISNAYGDTQSEDAIDGESRNAEGSESQPLPSESEPDSAEVNLSADFTDRSGYSYTLTLEQARTEATLDLENASPGMANIDWGIEYIAHLTNTTQDRNFPFFAAGESHIVPVWPQGSAVCDLQQARPAFYAEDAPEPARMSSIQEVDELELEHGVGPWCTIAQREDFIGRLFLDRQEETPIPKDSMISQSETESAKRPIIVPEEQAEALLLEIQSPAGWAMSGRVDDEGAAYTCGLGGLRASPLAATNIDPGCH